MVVRHRILWLIHTLCFVAIVHSTLLDINDVESCDLLCKQCNVSAIFANDHCECNFSNNNDKEAECIQHLQREIQAINLNTLSEDLTDEERGIRSLLKSRRRLRMGDADKVAQYFINGGPAAGHSHFIKAFNVAYDSPDSTTNSFSGVPDGNSPENEFHGEKPLNNAIFWNTYNSPLYMVPNAGSYPYSAGVETPIVEMVNPVVNYLANGLYDATSPLMGSILHPYRHGYRLPVQHNLHRTSNVPGQILYNLLDHYHLSHPVYYGGFRNSNNENPESVGQPAGESDDSCTVSKDPIARNNDAKSGEQNTANFLGSAGPAHYSIQTPYIVRSNTVYQPMEYQRFNVPYQYTSYRNPLINLLHPTTNEYVVQPEYIPQYIPGISDPLISASNPNSYCINTNAEQKDKVSTGKIVHSNNEATQSNNITKNNISEKENKAEK